MNVVILCGRLTKEPEVRRTQAQEPMAIARYTLAVDRRDKDKNTDFISCVTFGKNAEFVEKYLTKGTKVIVEGRLQTGSYTKQDGTKVYTTDVVVSSHEFAESKGDKPTATPATDNDGFMVVEDDMGDLPFANA